MSVHSWGELVRKYLPEEHLVRNGFLAASNGDSHATYNKKIEEIVQELQPLDDFGLHKALRNYKLGIDPLCNFIETIHELAYNNRDFKSGIRPRKEL